MSSELSHLYHPRSSMVGIMSIDNYTAYFHDGEILDITHSEDNIIITMASAEMDQDKYLDEKGNPVSDGHEHSHLYHPNQVWWP